MIMHTGPFLHWSASHNARRPADDRSLIRRKLSSDPTIKGAARQVLTFIINGNVSARFNRRAVTPGNEISSATHFGLPYHFLKLCPTASAGCTTPGDRGPRTPLPRLPPRAWWSLALLGHEVGPPACDPPRAAATGARRDSRAAPGPVASGDRAWAREALTRRTPGGPR